MKGYVIFQESVFDQVEFDRYKTMSPKSIEAFGGRFVVRGGPVEPLEGEFTFERVVVIEFPSVDAARAWYESDEYADAKALRLKISSGQAVLVEGV